MHTEAGGRPQEPPPRYGPPRSVAWGLLAFLDYGEPITTTERKRTMELVWKKPPPEAFVAQPNGFYALLATALREQPGEWAELPREYASSDSAKSAAANIRNGRVQALAKGQFEAVAHDKKIYARYVGHLVEESPDEAEAKVVQPSPTPTHDPVKVRQWASEQGIEVSKHGRLPDGLLRQYAAAQNGS